MSQSQGELEGQVALVTGGAIGIGQAICQDLSSAGARVIVVDRGDTSATVAAIREAGGEAIGVAADVTSEAEMAAAVQAGIDAFGGVDILVNNAGIFATLAQRPFEDIPLDEWRLVFEVNVLGCAVAAKSVLASMRSRGAGTIVNIASTTALKGSALPHYSSSKGAVLALTKNLAREFGPNWIRVNAVAPGFTVSTGVEQNADETARMRAGATSSRVLQREMVPSDVVGAVRFLAGPQSGFMTGQTVVVDGGAYFH
ncbi:MAG: family oxidoreductase [Subtercola sp.]|jgi:NAD(P)-dependent dehydrogenase (short-subunit alcohol dehydrogenase family)|nr:family oxidoreductase [Subtercola sp.]